MDSRYHPIHYLIAFALGSLALVGCTDTDERDVDGVVVTDEPVAQDARPDPDDLQVDRDFAARQDRMEERTDERIERMEEREGDARAGAVAEPASARRQQTADAAGAISVERSGAEEIRLGEPFEYRLVVTNNSSMALHGVTIREQTQGAIEILDASFQRPDGGQAIPAGYQRQGQPGARQEQRGQRQPGQQPDPETQEELRRRQQEAQGQRQPGQQPDPRRQDQEELRRQQQETQGQRQPGQQQNPRRQDQEELRRQQQQQQQQQTGRTGQRTSPAGTMRGRQEASLRRDRDQPGEAWTVGLLEPGQSATIQVRAVAHEEGTVQTCAVVEYAPAFCSTLEVGAPDLMVRAEVLRDAEYICDEQAIHFAVRNAGSAASEPVTLIVRLPEGLNAEGQSEIQENLGPIEPGEEAEHRIQLTADRGGRFDVRTLARAGDREIQSRTLTFEVLEPQLELRLDGPSEETIGRSLRYRATLRNTGDVPAQETVLAFELPEQARDLSISGGSGLQRASESMFQIGTLEPGDSRSLEVQFDLAAPGDITVRAMSEAYCVERMTETVQTTASGIPAILLEVVDERDPVPVGETTVYNIRVKNQGSAPGLSVDVRAQLPEGFELVQAEGETQASSEGNMITFATIERIEPGDVVGWNVEVRATAEGQVTFRVEMQSEAQGQEVYELEPTTVF
ncbi:MAG: hypothetical protein WD226_07280 [Planctomycetota bacterium]